MAIVNGKEGASGPEVNLLELRLDDIEDDGDTVFVVVTNHALVSVGSVRDDDTIFL